MLWAITIPVAAERVGQIALQWPGLRTLALRLAEPLDAPEAARAGAAAAPDGERPTGGEEIVSRGDRPRHRREVLSRRRCASRPASTSRSSERRAQGSRRCMTLALGLADPSDGG